MAILMNTLLDGFGCCHGFAILSHFRWENTGRKEIERGAFSEWAEEKTQIKGTSIV
jgi:hypothetical protein